MEADRECCMKCDISIMRLYLIDGEDLIHRVRPFQHSRSERAVPWFSI